MFLLRTAMLNTFVSHHTRTKNYPYYFFFFSSKYELFTDLGVARVHLGLTYLNKIVIFFSFMELLGNHFAIYKNSYLKYMVSTCPSLVALGDAT